MTIKEDPVNSPELDVYVPPEPSASPALPVAYVTAVETKPPVESTASAIYPRTGSRTPYVTAVETKPPVESTASAIYPRTGSRTPYVHNKPCLKCGNSGKGKMTIMTTKITKTGWIGCLYMGFICCPYFWLPLLIVRLLSRFLFVCG